jgi:hypothetical protein
MYVFTMSLEKKSLQHLEVRNTSLPISLILDYLPADKIKSLETDTLNYPFYKLKTVMDNLSVYVYANKPGEFFY